MVTLVFALRKKKYAILTIIFSCAMALFYPAVQVLPQGIRHFWFWFTILKPLDWFLYIIYAVLFGLSSSFFLWRIDERICTTKRLWGSGIFSMIGMLVANIIPVCPSCLAFLFLLVPVYAMQFFLTYRVWLMAGAIGMMVLGLCILGAFGRIALDTRT